METTRRNLLQGVAALAGAGAANAQAQSQSSTLPPQASQPSGGFHAGPGFPAVQGNVIAGVRADSGPHRSESGVGALMAWADRLWAITYLSTPGLHSGSGTGLYVIDETLKAESFR